MYIVKPLVLLRILFQYIYMSVVLENTPHLAPVNLGVITGRAKIMVAQPSLLFFRSST